MHPADWGALSPWDTMEMAGVLFARRATLSPQ